MAQRPEPRYAHKEVRQVAEWLKSLGFVFDDIDASDHPIFVWPATGQRIKLPGTPRGHVWKDNARKEAAAIAGVDITNKRNATAVKERANAERERAKAAQDKRRHDALAALAGKERASDSRRARRGSPTGRRSGTGTRGHRATHAPASGGCRMSAYIHIGDVRLTADEALDIADILLELEQSAR